MNNFKDMYLKRKHDSGITADTSGGSNYSNILGELTPSKYDNKYLLEEIKELKEKLAEADSNCDNMQSSFFSKESRLKIEDNLCT